MKKIILALTTVSLIACNQAEQKTESPATTTPSSVPTDMQGYTAAYSADFSIGDPAQSAAILSLWRDYEKGDLKASRPHFADSMTMFTADGSMMSGPSDSMIAGVQQYRNMFSSMTTRIDAIVPLKSNDHNENWVCVWGTEFGTINGKLDSTYLQETWRFNKDGKVDLLYQYMRPGTAKTMK